MSDPLPGPEPVDFLGLPLAPVTTGEFIDTVTGWAKAKRRARISYINAMCVNTAADSADYRACLQAADLIYADGQAIVWAARRLGCPVPERVNAGDFFIPFLGRRFGILPVLLAFGLRNLARSKNTDGEDRRSGTDFIPVQ